VQSLDRGIPGWFDAHPEVGTVFVSDQPTPPIVPRGHSILAAQVGAYIAVWNALPSTVHHIVVIRDNPYTHGDVIACVEEATAHHEDAGQRCAVPRDVALKVDPAAIAAEQLHSPRVQVIDMTPFFCDAQLCPAVIGGVLVYRDATHLTRAYATSLGPYLLREIRKLVSSWQ
jgi:SGNH domain (fused to AT3 domains)